jgi:uncharacterized iron-regulated protein
MEPVRLLLALLLATGCAARPEAKPAAPAPPHRPPPAHPPRAPLDPDVVERARAPFHGIRVRDRARLDQAALLDALADSDVLCLGERHDEPAHHFVQLTVIEHLADRAAQTARQLGVGFEMVSRPHQAVLDRYRAGALDEAALARELAWQKSWGFDFALYRPLFERARRVGADLLALNAPRSVVREVARRGLSGLSKTDRATLPALDLDDAEHRAVFDRAMAEHPNTGMRADHLYAAQVLWDETMADVAATWLEQGRSARQLVILAGAGHCHESAIVRRIVRRIPVQVASVLIRAPHEPAPGATPTVDYHVVIETPESTPPPAS